MEKTYLLLSLCFLVSAVFRANHHFLGVQPGYSVGNTYPGYSVIKSNYGNETHLNKIIHIVYIYGTVLKRLCTTV